MLRIVLEELTVEIAGSILIGLLVHLLVSWLVHFPSAAFHFHIKLAIAAANVDRVVPRHPDKWTGELLIVG